MPNNEIGFSSGNKCVRASLGQTRVTASTRARKATIWFCVMAIRTKLSRIFLLRLKEIRGLSVKMAYASGLFLMIWSLRIVMSLTFDWRGWNVKAKGILSSAILAKDSFRVSRLEILKNFESQQKCSTKSFSSPKIWSQNLCHRCKGGDGLKIGSIKSMDCLVWLGSGWRRKTKDIFVSR